MERAQVTHPLLLLLCVISAAWLASCGQAASGSHDLWSSSSAAAARLNAMNSSGRNSQQVPDPWELINVLFYVDKFGCDLRELEKRLKASYVRVLQPGDSEMTQWRSVTQEMEESCYISSTEWRETCCAKRVGTVRAHKEELFEECMEEAEEYFEWLEEGSLHLDEVEEDYLERELELLSKVVEIQMAETQMVSADELEEIDEEHEEDDDEDEGDEGDDDEDEETQTRKRKQKKQKNAKKVAKKRYRDWRKKRREERARAKAGNEAKSAASTGKRGQEKTLSEQEVLMRHFVLRMKGAELATLAGVHDAVPRAVYDDYEQFRGELRKCYASNLMGTFYQKAEKRWMGCTMVRFSKGRVGYCADVRELDGRDARLQRAPVHSFESGRMLLLRQKKGPSATTAAAAGTTGATERALRASAAGANSKTQTVFVDLLNNSDDVCLNADISYACYALCCDTMYFGSHFCRDSGTTCLG